MRSLVSPKQISSTTTSDISQEPLGPRRSAVHLRNADVFLATPTSSLSQLGAFRIMSLRSRPA